MVSKDEKDFTLEIMVNIQNDRVHGKGKRDIKASLYNQYSRLKKTMVYALVFYRMKTLLEFHRYQQNEL